MRSDLTLPPIRPSATAAGFFRGMLGNLQRAEYEARAVVAPATFALAVAARCMRAPAIAADVRVIGAAHLRHAVVGGENVVGRCAALRDIAVATGAEGDPLQRVRAGRAMRLNNSQRISITELPRRSAFNCEGPTAVAAADHVAVRVRVCHAERIT